MPVEYEIKLEEEQVQQLRHLLGRKDDIDKVVKAAMEGGPSSSIAAFAEQVASKTSLAKRDSFRILVAILGLRFGQTMAKASPDEFLDAIRAALLADGYLYDWRTDEISAWDDIQEQLKTALSEFDENSPPLVSSKANFLAYQRERLLSEARIISDIRPVFDKDANKILEMVVTHSLIVDYRDGLSTQAIHFTLDEQDIANLIEQCQRAQKKAKTIVASLKGQAWKTVVFPESKQDKK